MLMTSLQEYLTNLTESETDTKVVLVNDRDLSKRQWLSSIVTQVTGNEGDADDEDDGQQVPDRPVVQLDVDGDDDKQDGNEEAGNDDDENEEDENAEETPKTKTKRKGKKSQSKSARPKSKSRSKPKPDSRSKSKKKSSKSNEVDADGNQVPGSGAWELRTRSGRISRQVVEDIYDDDNIYEIAEDVSYHSAESSSPSVSHTSTPLHSDDDNDQDNEREDIEELQYFALKHVCTCTIDVSVVRNKSNLV